MIVATKGHSYGFDATNHCCNRTFSNVLLLLKKKKKKKKKKDEDTWQFSRCTVDFLVAKLPPILATAKVKLSRIQNACL